MAAYTLEVTNGTTTYTFSASATLPPTWRPKFSYERNFDVSPSVLTMEIETWDLRGFALVSATPGTITTDLDTLSTLLRNKASPVTTATLKYDGSAVRALKTTGAGGSHLDVYALELNTADEPGQWVNHWSGDLVIVGRRQLATSTVVNLKKELSDEYDLVGRHTQTLTGEVEVSAGTDVSALAATYALTSLGANFVFTTGGAQASGGANIDIEVIDYASTTPTKARFRSQQVQRMNASPSTALDFHETSGTSDNAGGRIGTAKAVAIGTTTTRALTAARTVKPSTAVQFTVEDKDEDSLSATATYTTRAPLPVQAAYYGVPSAITITRRVTIRGGGQARIFEPVPGYQPYRILGARATVRVTERVDLRCTAVVAPGDIPMPALLFAADHLQPGESEEESPWRAEKAEHDSADLWCRGITRVYEFATDDEIDLDALFAAVAQPIGWSGDLLVKSGTHA